jgi:hypothetical protein
MDANKAEKLAAAKKKVVICYISYFFDKNTSSALKS